MSIEEMLEEFNEITYYLEDLTENFDMLNYLSIDEVEQLFNDNINESVLGVEGFNYKSAEELKANNIDKYDAGLSLYIHNVNENFKNDFSNGDFSVAYNIEKGLEDKVNRREELNEAIDRFDDIYSKLNSKFKI